MITSETKEYLDSIGLREWLTRLIMDIHDGGWQDGDKGIDISDAVEAYKEDGGRIDEALEELEWLTAQRARREG